MKTQYIKLTEVDAQQGKKTLKMLKLFKLKQKNTMCNNKNLQSAFIMGKKALHFSLVPREAGLIQSQWCVCMCLHVCDCPQSNLGIK